MTTPQEEPTQGALAELRAAAEELAKEAREELDAHHEWLCDNPDEQDPGPEEIYVHPARLLQIMAAWSTSQEREAALVAERDEARFIATWSKSFGEAHDAMQDALKAIAYHADNQDIGHVDFRMKAKGQAEFTLEQCAGDAGMLDGPPLPPPDWTTMAALVRAAQRYIDAGDAYTQTGAADGDDVKAMLEFGEAEEGLRALLPKASAPKEEQEQGSSRITGQDQCGEQPEAAVIATAALAAERCRKCGRTEAEVICCMEC